MRRIIVPLIVVALLAVGVTGLRLMRGGGTTFSALFDSTVGLYRGSDVEILGVPVGTVTAVEPTGDKVRVTMRLDRGQKVAADTAAVIIAPTLVSDRYVQLTTPYTSGKRLASGATITRTAVPVEVDKLYQSLDSIAKDLGPDGANKNGALSRLLQVAAANLQGNGKDINTMIGEFGKATGTLADSGDDLFATIGNLESINKVLAQHDTSVAGINRQFAAVTDELAGDRDDMAAAVANLGDAMADLDGFIKDNRDQLKASVQKLVGPTQVLVNQKKSLREAVKLIPLALQDFLQAYDVTSNTIEGRADLNELSLWAKDGLSGRTSANAPPTLIPGLGDDR
ncbi:MCE family protein [Nocardioides sp. BP30]|uniref:MCE family protein n=1 Tax=Nocardioides sp. BP30 TaxID=3036374 RepID=UPI002468FE27|nr:MCE family protein [Nocardioides sp. BP30]WGL53044.1 MCE family protein [Nocardioides sp. BP30]